MVHEFINWFPGDLSGVQTKHIWYKILCAYVVWQVYIEYFESIQLEVPVVYTVFITEHPNRLS